MINVLVTGGAGFIGSNFVRYAIAAHADWHVTTLDKLTYAGRLENLKSLDGHPRHTFVHGDIADAAVAAPLVQAADYVVHFAAETHVDRSIREAGEFIKTDVIGTFVLLEAARQAPNLKRFVQISTDEVYGSVPEGSSRETDELRPRNPYSASKAGADRLAYSFWATYGVPVDRHPRLEQLRPEPVPREGHPALHHQPDRRPAGAALRRRAERPRLAARRGSLPRRRPAAHDERARRGLQHRRRQRGEERRPHPPPARARRAADVADPARQRSARPRSPVFARHLEAAGARLAAEARLRGRPGPDGRAGIARTSGGGARSRNRTPPSRPTTRRSTPSAARSDAGVARSSRPASSSPAAPASPRATCSIGC